MWVGELWHFGECCAWCCPGRSSNSNLDSFEERERICKYEIKEKNKEALDSRSSILRLASRIGRTLSLLRNVDAAMKWPHGEVHKEKERKVTNFMCPSDH